MKLISSPVKRSQLKFPTPTWIKSRNTSILVHTLSDIRFKSFILYVIDNLPSLSNVALYLLPVLDIGLQMATWKIIFTILF